MNIIKNLNLSFTVSNNGVKRYFDFRDAMAKKYGGNHVVMGKYLHIIFNPIKEKELEILIKEMGVNLPTDYIRLLKLYNGLVLYSGTLAIYGFGRELIDGMTQVNRNPNYEYPFHLSDYNQNLTSTRQLTIGTFNDMKIIYNLQDNGNYVYLLDSKDNLISQWNNLENAISELVNEISNLYDEQGIVKNPKIVGNYVFNRPAKIKREN